jgi:hypothetical protein
LLFLDSACAVAGGASICVHMAATAAALAVTDELALPLRAVGDLAAAAGVSREEVVVITQCASLGELLLVSFGLFEYFSPEICLNTESIYSD